VPAGSCPPHSYRQLRGPADVGDVLAMNVAGDDDDDGDEDAE